MLSPHEQLICARQILSGEFFPPTEENLAIEKALESIGALERFRVSSITVRKRIASDPGGLLLNDLSWLLDGDEYARSGSTALNDLIETMARSAQTAKCGKRANPGRSRPPRALTGL